MLSLDQVTAQIEQIGDSSVGTQESLSLPDRFEPPHSSLSYPSSDASFSQEIFDISVAEVESVVQPNRIANDVGGLTWRNPHLIGLGWRRYWRSLNRPNNSC